MQTPNIIQGETEEQVWQQVNEQIAAEPDPFEYSAVIEQGGKRIYLTIDIDPGGGFEGGYETTTYKAALHNASSFRFALHHQHFMDEVGKLFGTEDVNIGYDDFDKKLVVKTNDPVKVRKVFSDTALRVFFQNLDDFSLSVTHESEHHEEQYYLMLNIDKGITEPTELRKLYHAFYTALQAIEGA